MTLRDISRKREHCLEKLEKKPSERKGKKGSGTKNSFTKVAGKSNENMVLSQNLSSTT